MPCYCANYYGAINCQNKVIRFGERCHLCLVLNSGASLGPGRLPCNVDEGWVKVKPVAVAAACGGPGGGNERNREQNRDRDRERSLPRVDDYGRGRDDGPLRQVRLESRLPQ